MIGIIVVWTLIALAVAFVIGRLIKNTGDGDQ